MVRRHPGALTASAGDSGAIQPPPDLPIGPTILRAFDLPPENTDTAHPTVFAAASGSAGWAGAALYLDRAGELVPLGLSARASATIGVLSVPLGRSTSMLFEPHSALDIVLVAEGGGFAPATLAGLLMGANRLLVGGEIVQFARADQTGPFSWRLTGLLRGRGGTEAAALAGHPENTEAVLIDQALVALDPALVPIDPATILAAIGRKDGVPVYAALANAGRGRTPLAPVHPRCAEREDGGLLFGWTRRARGAWEWADGVEVPLVEESELYRIGYGPAEAPLAEWTAIEPAFVLDGAVRANLVASHPGHPLWVRQAGSYAQSDALLLALNV